MCSPAWPWRGEAKRGEGRPGQGRSPQGGGNGNGNMATDSLMGRGKLGP
jgi:hypothetical protein